MKFLAVVFMTCLLSACPAPPPKHYVDGVVTAKNYAPSSSGTGISTSGKLVFTSSDEQYTVEIDDGKYEIEVEKSTYIRLRVGTKVSIDANGWSPSIHEIKP